MEDRTTKGTAKKMSAETFNELLREIVGEHKRKELSGLRYKQGVYSFTGSSTQASTSDHGKDGELGGKLGEAAQWCMRGSREWPQLWKRHKAQP